jgi:hypothetical protein
MKVEMSDAFNFNFTVKNLSRALVKTKIKCLIQLYMFHKNYVDIKTYLNIHNNCIFLLFVC